MPSHVDLSVLWIPLMPETSKLGPAMEQAGTDATESFGKGSSGLGDKIHDSFTKATGKVKDVFHKAGNDASESMADGVKQKSTVIEDALEDSGKKASGRFKGAFDGLAEKLGTEIGAKLGGGIGDQLQKLDGYAQTVGVDISEWTSPLKDAQTGFDQLKSDGAKFASQITDVSSNFEGMPGKVGKLASAISELAVPIGMVEQGLEKINDLFDKAGGKRKWDDVVNPTDPNAGQGFWDKAGRLFQSWAPGGTFDKGPGPAGPPPGGWWGYGGSNPGNLAPLFPGIPGGAPPAHGDRQLPLGGWFGGGGHPASRHIGSDKGLTPTSVNVKDVVASAFPQISDIGGWRPPDKYGEHSSGQALDVMIPGWDTPQGQALGTAIKDYVTQHGKELGVDYALWQQTQWNPGGGKSSMENRGSPNDNHFTHVHIHTTRGGGTGGGLGDLAASSAGGDNPLGGTSFGGGMGAPDGTPGNPIFVAVAGSGGAPGGGGGSLGSGGGMGAGGPQMPDFLGGAMQGLGLDGSVFHTFGGASNPMQFGATKLGMGLLNVFGGMLGGGGAGTAGTHVLDHGPGGLPLAELGAHHMALPGMAPASAGTRNQPSGQLIGGSGGGGMGAMGASMGGKGGGINAAISGAIGLAGAAFSDLSPGVGAPDSAKGQYHLLPNPTVSHPNPGGGAAGQGETVTNHNYYGNVGPQLNVQQHNVKSPTEDLQQAANGAGNRMAAMGATNNAGILPATG